MSGALETRFEGLRRVAPDEVAAAAPTPVDDATRARASEIVEAVRAGGEPALRGFAAELDGLPPEAPLVLGEEDFDRALEATPRETRALIERVARRVRTFAEAQVASLSAIDVPVPGGRAGHDVVPVQAAGCYAPGGRYPLPSSVLMTAVTARAAGVPRVVVATPNPGPLMVAAAAIAGADAVLAAGGAHGIAALASGLDGAFGPSDVIVGPGNRWVTAAKQIVAAGSVGIDLPAGPSELCVLADDAADPDLVAADLLAQAEHDPDARPTLVARSAAFVDRVDERLRERLGELATRGVAAQALAHGVAVIAADEREAFSAVDDLAPEHLQLCVADPARAKEELKHFGAAFLGEGSAEVFGDYGIGPNHVLPTGGAARFSGGLSALHFLRVRTWLRLDEPAAAIDDCAALAELEQLDGHRRAALARRS